MPFETDWIFTQEDFDRRYNSDLANDLGNALNRSLAMSHKFVGGVVPDGLIEAEAQGAIVSAKAAYEAAMEVFRLDHAVEAAWSLVRFLNKYIDTRAPWALAKAGDSALPNVMRSMLLCLRACEGLVRPTMPFAADAIAAQLNLPALKLWREIGEEQSLPVGTELSQPQPIFPRLDTKKEQPMPDTQQPTPETSQISINEFAKVQFKIGRVIESVPVEGSDKLVKLDVMIGEERRQIVAGIRKSYEPLDLVGRQVVVVANLKPAMLRGVESQGMLLAADDGDGGAILLQPEKEAPEGAKVR